MKQLISIFYGQHLMARPAYMIKEYYISIRSLLETHKETIYEVIGTICALITLVTFFFAFIFLFR